ncbi:Mpo1-like protein [Pseudoalteromonas ardens]|uniref:Terminase n=1 Tax=Pseudoalteromonas rubra TaxID=43658 RepID=A0A0L0EQF4_9GAMM|nr:Mpo1-like protein [Pseudoalteromonas sp. R96]KNC66626.1 terminase [Pseudoalteromonas rubra]MDK1311051.1 DUF962 domain-containing protein [Pseudoalteromonas sp. R96]
MKIKALLAWQWQGYETFHQSTINLWLHIVAVPLFILGFALCFAALFFLNITLFGSATLLMVGSLIAQGIGHKEEALPPAPFTGALNAVLRIILEQVYTFPKFVLTGGWYAALKGK